MGLITITWKVNLKLPFAATTAPQPQLAGCTKTDWWHHSFCWPLVPLWITWAVTLKIFYSLFFQYILGECRCVQKQLQFGLKALLYYCWVLWKWYLFKYFYDSIQRGNKNTPNFLIQIHLGLCAIKVNYSSVLISFAIFSASTRAPVKPLPANPAQYKPFFPFQLLGGMSLANPLSSKRSSSCSKQMNFLPQEDQENCITNGCWLVLTHLKPLICRSLKASGEDYYIKWMWLAVLKYHFTASDACQCWQNLGTFFLLYKQFYIFCNWI